MEYCETKLNNVDKIRKPIIYELTNEDEDEKWFNDFCQGFF